MTRTNRRELLKTIGAGGTVVVAGCTGDPDDGNGGGNGNGNGNGGGNGNGNGNGGGNGNGSADVREMTYVESSVPSTIDPHTVDTTITAALLAYPENAYETLLYYPPEAADDLVPALASEVPDRDNGLIRDEGRVFEFPLREGVTFHTGEEMTAEDVVFSWERAMTLGLSTEVGRLDVVENIEALDEYTVEVTLNSPFAPFLTTVITRPVASIVSKAAVEDNGGVTEGEPNEWMSQNTAGTGPFMAGTFEPDNQIAWEPHEDYWGETGVDRVIQIQRPDLSSRISMIQQGDAHAARIPADNLEDVEGTPNAKFTFWESFDPVHITFNFDIPYDLDNMPDDDTIPPDFFQDPDVRKGFGYAFDYDTYIEQVWNGHSTRMNQYHFPGSLGFDESAPNFEHDPDQAEEHFRNAGVWEEGFTITCYNETIPQFERGNLLLKDNIESLNDSFTLNLESIPESQMEPRHSAPQFEFPMEFHGFLPQGPDPDVYYREIYSPNGSVGTRSSVEEILDGEMELIDQASVEPDVDERASIYEELQRECFDNPAVIGISVEEIMQTTHECVEPIRNPAWIQPHFKHWDISNCDF